MKNHIPFLILLLFSTAGFSQTCDTVTNINVSSIGFNSAYITFTGAANASTYFTAIKDSATGATAYSVTSPSTVVFASGLTTNKKYKVFITSFCNVGAGTITANLTRNPVFLTKNNIITYTPMTAAGYQFKYMRVDSGLALPFRDTALGRAGARPGTVVYGLDSNIYLYNGVIWERIEGSGATDTTHLSLRINKKQNQFIINVKDAPYNAKGDGVTNDAAALQAAFNAGAGKIVIAEGTFRTDTVLTLQSNSTYLFNSATFIGGTNCISYVFRTIGKVNIKINGGTIDYVAGVTPPITIGTGTYSQGSAWHFENCTNIVMDGQKSKRMWGVVNFYNCHSSSVTKGYFVDCNAALAGVAWTNGAGVPKQTNISFNFNTIISCGDDGIVYGSVGVGVTDGGQVIGNTITKTTRSNGELDGSTGAAVAIRIGFGGITYNVNVNDNHMYDMVAEGLMVTRVEKCTFTNNTLKKWSKTPFRTGFVFGYGDSLYVKDCIIDGNIADSAVNPFTAFAFNAVYGGSVTNNQGFTTGSDFGSASFLEVKRVKITNNTFHNKAGYSIRLDALCDSNIVSHNDVTVHVGQPAIIDFGTNNLVEKNIGLPYSNSTETLQTVRNRSNVILVAEAANTASEAIRISGAVGAARDLLLVGQSGYSNGLSVKYNGTSMKYRMDNGDLFLQGKFENTDSVKIGAALEVNGKVKLKSLSFGMITDSILVIAPDSTIRKAGPIPAAISLTTNNSSGAATLIGGTLNIPQYAEPYGYISNSSTASIFPAGTLPINRYMLNGQAQNLTVNAPTGTSDGHSLLLRISATGAFTLTWDAIYRASTDFSLPTITTANKTMYVQFVYNNIDSKWDAILLTKGF